MDVMMTAEQKVGWRVQMKAVMTVVMTVALKAVLKVELKADPMVDSKADQKALRMIELLAMKRGNNESKQTFHTQKRHIRLFSYLICCRLTQRIGCWAC